MAARIRPAALACLPAMNCAFYASASSPSSSSSSRTPAHQRRFPAYFVRGGTSNGLVIREDVLPAVDVNLQGKEALAARADAWKPLLVPAMGSPDAAYGRQLDGMGSGVSSTSKICVIAAPSAAERHADGRDVNFTFVQVGIRDGRLDLAGNCGNMISAVGPLAFELGWGGVVEGEGAGRDRTALVRIFNTNTSKLIRSQFRVEEKEDDEKGEKGYRFSPNGDYSIDGVPGTHSCITLSFERPAGAKSGAQNGLPTGQPVDLLPLEPPDSTDDATGLPTIAASLVDVSNPGVFVLGSALGLDVGLSTAQIAAQIDADADGSLKRRLGHLRRAGAVRMGLDPDAESVPKIVLIFPPQGGGDGEDPTEDIRCVALSMGQVHKAVPLTLALCLGAAARIPGTLAAQLVADRRASPASTAAAVATNTTTRENKEGGSHTIVIGHPGGRVDVGTTLDEADGTILSAELLRTARVLMEGTVFY